MKRIDPNKKLDGHLLRGALVSLYHCFASICGTDGDERKRYEETIPGMVFDAAIGAGWLDFTDDEKSPIQQADWHPSSKTISAKWVLEHIDLENARRKPNDPKPGSAKRDRDHVLFDDWIVERAYLDSFFALLRDPISFHLATGTETEELLKRLPAKTSKVERTALLDQYIKAQGGKDGGVTKVIVAQRAEVDYSVLTKWKNDKLPDTNPASQRISLLVRFDKRIAKRRYYKSYDQG